MAVSASSALVLLLIGVVSVASQGDKSVTIYTNPNSPSSIDNSSCWFLGEDHPCKSLDLGVRGLWTLSQERTDGTTTLMIASGRYVLSAETPTDFNRTGPLMIIGENKSVEIECQRGAGFSFIYVSGSITLKNIYFHACGALQTSTTYNLNESNPDFLQFNVGLYFLYCANVTMENVSVLGTSGTAVVLYNTVGTNRMERCAFSSNVYNSSESHPTGGAVLIEFTFCEPGSIFCLNNTESVVDQNFTHGANYTFSECWFLYNIANLRNISEHAFILPNRIHQSSFGRGGGIAAFFKGNASNNSILVEECSFLKNRAVWGAALFIEFQDWSHDNNCTIRDTVMTNNTLHYDDTLNEGTGGGAVRLGFVFYKDLNVHGNKVLFENCSFSHNNAYWGGGISFYSSIQERISFPLNLLTISNCTFHSNAGRLGTALDLSSLWHSLLLGKHMTPIINNCTFINNSVHFDLASHAIAGIGAVYVDTLPVHFTGSNLFEANSGTALAILSNLLFVRDDSIIRFYGNSGRQGGAVSIMGNGYILMGENTRLEFINNTAQYKGGAIYAYRSGEHDLISSRNCFIRYNDIESSPEKWKASFYFRNNTANGKKNSIYASTILPCVWGASYGSSKDSDELKRKVFCWKSWTYHNNSNCTNEVGSAPVNYRMNDSYTAIPGKLLPLGIEAKDALGNDVTNDAIFLTQIYSGNASFRGSSTSNYDYTSKNALDLRGQPNSTIKLQIETIDPIVIRSEIEVQLQNCPPGLTQSSSSPKTTVCQCPNSGKGNAFGGYLKCDGESFQSTLLHHSWLGYIDINGTNETVVGRSPYVNSISMNESIQLPSENLNDFFCKTLNRKGILCGSCIPNYGPSITSTACVPCPDEVEGYSWLLYVVAVFVPNIMFFVCVFIFSMTATFGPLNAFIFFAQVITTVAMVNAEGTLVFFNSVFSNDSASLALMNAFHDFYTVVYDVWNLDFFRPWIPHFCLSSHINSATVLCLSYLSALYPLMFLALLSFVLSLYNRGVRPCVHIFRPFHRCLARTRGWLKLRKPITGGIAIFLVISYTKFTLVSFALLLPNPLYDASGTVVKQVLYVDGDIEYGASSALYITIASALLIVFGIAPPVLLIIPSILHGMGRVCHHPIIGKLQPSGKTQQFLEVFHGRFKDGTNGTLDCRWFAGLYFALRLVLFATYLANHNTLLYQYTLQLNIFLCAAFLFAVIRPYKQDWINNVDTTIFLNLAAITTLSIYNLSLARLGYKLSLWAYCLQCILIMVPLIYCIAYFIIQICHKRVKRFYNQKIASLRHPHVLDVSQDMTTSEASLRQSLTDSTGIQNFLDFTDSAGRLNTPTTRRERLTNPTTWRHDRNSRETANDSEQEHLLSGEEDEVPVDT